ncbi:MAG: FAD-dependent oxidoreductase [Candidatus Omnitrophota bacterium]
MPKKRVIILGAGLAGLSAAWHLRKKGCDCRVFEKESQVGGLCRSKQINGFTFDCDGHLLHFKSPYAFKLVKALLGDNLAEHQRNAWVYSQGRFTRYPFQANLYGLPPAVVKECLLGFIRASRGSHCKDKKDVNFLRWMQQTFGRGIARHFMVPYNNKFWTVPSEELTCEWLDGFIPVPLLEQVIQGARKESRGQFGYNARFWYPKRGGINQVPLALAQEARHIYTNCPVTEIDLAKKEIKIGPKTKERFDFLISTIPLPEIPNIINTLPNNVTHFFGKLRWNSIFNLNLGLEKNDGLRRHWVYYPEEKICFFRIGFPHNFSSSVAPEGKGSMYIEVSYSQNKRVDKNNIAARVRKDLARAGMLTGFGRICAEDVNDIKYGYPIYDINYHEARARILKFLARNNIYACGRYGSWRYMSMEDVILQGKETARLLTG